MLATSQYQPSLSNITNVAPGGSTNQIAVFTSNEITTISIYSIASSLLLSQNDERQLKLEIF